MNFSHLALADGVSVIKIIGFSQIEMNTLYFYRVYRKVYSDESNTIIDLSEIFSTVNSNITINDVSIEESTATNLKISNSQQIKVVDQYININRFSSSSQIFLSSATLVLFENIEDKGGIFQITINDITFYNMTFTFGGHLMYLRHQTPQPMVINRINSYDISNGGISIESYNTAVSDKTKVHFVDANVTKIDGLYRSFIEAYEGTDIQFNNSVFYHMSNLNKGTVLHADYQQVVATFYD